MTLLNFFKLNEPFTEMVSQEALVEHFRISNDLRNVLYRPDVFAPRDPYRLNDKVLENVSFSKTKLANLVFRDCVFRDCLFIGTEFFNCEFHDCSFERCNPHKATFESCYIDPARFARLLDPRTQANIGVHLFNQLEQNARDREQHEFVATASFLYRKWRRHYSWFRYEQGHVRAWRFWPKWLLDKTYDLVAGYGWRAGRFLGWSAVLFLIVATVNLILWDRLGMSFASPKAGPPWLTAWYFTIVTFTTLGYGDITPTSQLGMVAASTEALLGLLWLSTLASVVFRRIFR
jgi:hypothetical protein